MSANADLFEFLIGEWTVEFQRLPEGANVGRHATVKADWFLDGTPFSTSGGTSTHRER